MRQDVQVHLSTKRRLPVVAASADAPSPLSRWTAVGLGVMVFYAVLGTALLGIQAVARWSGPAASALLDYRVGVVIAPVLASWASGSLLCKVALVPVRRVWEATIASCTILCAFGAVLAFSTEALLYRAAFMGAALLLTVPVALGAWISTRGVRR